MTTYDSGMAVERMTVSLDADLAHAVRLAADEDTENISAWLADAARRRLAARGLADVVAEWEAVHGAFTADELDQARARLGS